MEKLDFLEYIVYYAIILIVGVSIVAIGGLFLTQ